MTVTNAFIDHPCKMICIPYLVLFVFAFIAFYFGMFDISTGQEDSLLLSDPILIEREMISKSGDYIGTEEIAKEEEEMLRDRLRYRAGRRGTVYMLYQSTDLGKGALNITEPVEEAKQWKAEFVEGAAEVSEVQVMTTAV